MIKKYSKILTLVALVSVILPACLLAMPVLAQADLNLGVEYAEGLGLSNADPRVAAVSLIRLLMTFLGIIAVVIILLGGFKWMTAAGNDDKVAEAKKLISAGIIGLVIILSAFLIVSFVVDNVSGALQGA